MYSASSRFRTVVRVTWGTLGYGPSIWLSSAAIRFRIAWRPDGTGGPSVWRSRHVVPPPLRDGARAERTANLAGTLAADGASDGGSPRCGETALGGPGDHRSRSIRGAASPRREAQGKASGPCERDPIRRRRRGTPAQPRAPHGGPRP